MPILYFDTEMNEREQEDRILANLSGVPHSEICSGLYVMDTAHGKSEDKIARIKEARDKLKMGHYYHIHIPQFSSDMVMAIAKKFVLQFGVRAIFFDYIKIPSSQAGQKNQQEYQQLGYLASSLKEMAGILDVPVYTACQTNRDDLENENPDASNIGGSYRILQLASKLIFLVNKSPMTIAKEGKFNGNQRLLIKYQRNGMSDCPPINVMFDKNILRQEEC
jgi:replicative DNA helicase